MPDLSPSSNELPEENLGKGGGKTERLRFLLRSMQELPPLLKFFLAVIGFAILASEGIAIALVVRGAYGYAFGVQALTLGFSLLFPLTSRSGGNQKGTAPDTIIWCRAVPKRPLPGHVVQGGRRILEDIADHTLAFLLKKGVMIHPEDIRTHVTMIDLQDCSRTGYCELMVDKELRHNMEGFRDESMRMRVGQGFAGKAYADPEMRIVRARCTLDSNGGLSILPDTFDFTEKQKASIEPSLRWAIAMPLFSFDQNNAKEFIGVLGIQGLNQAINKDDLLKELAVNISLKAVALGQLLREAPAQRLEIVTKG